MKGAGGTSGGTGSFFLGLGMTVAGVYLLLRSISVQSGFSMGYGFWQVGGFSVTSGMILVPAMIGVGMVFWNARNPIGWLLSVGSVLALVVGVITSLRFTLAHMNLFELLTILVLCFGGAGLFLRSLRDS
ncbi:MAG: hypothetical protein RL318_553 [Fibrobacterota bacterium]|jgi:hypothetical protein